MTTRREALYGLPLQAVLHYAFHDAQCVVAPGPDYASAKGRDVLGAAFDVPFRYLLQLELEAEVPGKWDYGLLERMSADRRALALALREARGSQRALFALGQAYERTRKLRRGVKAGRASERYAYLLGVAHALHRKFGLPRGEPDAVAALAGQAARTAVQDWGGEGPLFRARCKVLCGLLSGAKGVRSRRGTGIGAQVKWAAEHVGRIVRSPAGRVRGDELARSRLYLEHMPLVPRAAQILGGALSDEALRIWRSKHRDLLPRKLPVDEPDEHERIPLGSCYQLKNQ